MAYTIKSGDTLSKIAKEKNLSVEGIMKLNPQIKDPNKIFAGDTLNLDVSPPKSNISVDINPDLAPSVGTNSSDVLASTKGAEGLSVNTIKSYTDLVNKLSEIKPPETKETSKIKSMLQSLTGKVEEASKQPDISEIAKQATQKALEQLGLSEDSFKKIGSLVNEVSAYNQQIADLQKQKAEALSLNEKRAGRGIEMLTAEANRISKFYDRQIAAVSAQAASKATELNLLHGLYNEAKQAAQQAVDAALYEHKQKMYDINWQLDTYKDLISTLSQDEKEAWAQKYNAIIKDYEEARREREAVAELKLKNPGADIDIVNDSYEEAVRKAAEAAGLAETSSSSDWQIITDAEGNMWSVNKITGEKRSLGLTGKSSEGEDIRVPTIYGLTKKQTKDVLFSDVPPKWFLDQASMTTMQSLTPKKAKQLWEEYKKQTIERHKKIKQETGAVNPITQLWNEMTSPTSAENQNDLSTIFNNL